VGLVCWTGAATAAADDITRLEHAISNVAGKAACPGDPLFLPRDEASAWAWLPLGTQDTFDTAAGGGRDRGGWSDGPFGRNDLFVTSLGRLLPGACGSGR
jgi:hypothetical protein